MNKVAVSQSVCVWLRKMQRKRRLESSIRLGCVHFVIITVRTTTTKSRKTYCNFRRDIIKDFKTTIIAGQVDRFRSDS
jgi:hypothetical protein